MWKNLVNLHKLYLTSEYAPTLSSSWRWTIKLFRPIDSGGGTLRLEIKCETLLYHNLPPTLHWEGLAGHLQLIQQPLLLLSGLYIPSTMSCSLIRWPFTRGPSSGGVKRTWKVEKAENVLSWICAGAVSAWQLTFRQFYGKLNLELYFQSLFSLSLARFT